MSEKAKETNTKNRNKILSIVYIGVSAALIAICSWIQIPLTVPITLQTMGVCLVSGLLGLKRGTLATLVYIVLGAIGVPVFAGYSAGVSCIAGMTGGYIVAYPVLAFLTGLLYWKFGKNQTGKLRILWMLLSMVIGTVVLYAIGTAWFCVVSGTGVAAAMGLCVIPFLPGDFLKMVVVILISLPIEKALAKMTVAEA